MFKTADIQFNRVANAFALHAGIALLISAYRPLAKLFFVLLFLFFVIRIFKAKDKVFLCLMALAYMASAEVFLRMTKAMPLWEMGKYSVIFFASLGMYFNGFKLKAWPTLIYILLLIPGIYIAFLNYEFIDVSFRKTILFNLSGPLSLTFTALFCFQREINFDKMMRLVDVMIFPLVTTLIYIILVSPSLDEVQFTTESNAAVSGGYSGNQVSTVLGLGMFLCYTRFLIPHKNKLLQIGIAALLALFSYRAVLTFSRGGVITAILMMLIFTALFINWAPIVAKAKATLKLTLLGAGAIVLWGAIVAATGGLILNRYTGKTAAGEDRDITTGRGDLLSEEIEMFIENPFFGIGTGVGKFYRLEQLGITAASHNEVSRMIGEHGMLGIIALLILILTPVGLFLTKSRNLFLIPFTAFWFLTINHTGMRIALPGFLYGFALLKITYATKSKKNKEESKKPNLHRQQTLQTG